MEMEYTENLHLNKPEATDLYDIGNENDNMDTLDTAVSTNATNITALQTAMAGKQNTLTFDNVPTANSSNPVKSGGVYSAIDTLNTAVQGKQDKLHTEMKTGTLAAGSTSLTLTFTTETIGTDTLVDVYSDTFGVNPTSISTTSNAVTLVFDAQNSTVKVAVVITN
jgi:hypothetical protein